MLAPSRLERGGGGRRAMNRLIGRAGRGSTGRRQTQRPSSRRVAGGSSVPFVAGRNTA